MTTDPTLILLLLAQELAAWLVRPGRSVERLPIHGSTDPALCTDAAHLRQAIDDLRERYPELLKRNFRLEWVFDDASAPVLLEALPRLTDPNSDPPELLAASRWQLLRWESAARRAGAVSERPPAEWIESDLIPLLLTDGRLEEEERLKAAIERDHAERKAELAREREALLAENERLRAQNAALRQVDGERLLTFLPALFPRVFTELSGADLALLTGRVEPYNIPNPYPEPSAETLDTLQRDFRALPREHQREVVAFLARLPQRAKLQPRPEMRALIRELESEIGP